MLQIYNNIWDYIECYSHYDHHKLLVNWYRPAKIEHSSQDLTLNAINTFQATKLNDQNFDYLYPANIKYSIVMSKPLGFSGFLCKLYNKINTFKTASNKRHV